MAGQINVFGWGTKGVNLVKSPLELDDQELQKAQNIEVFREGGLYGVRKRFGLQKVVPTGTVTPGAPAPGPIFGTITIPDTIGFFPPSQQAVYIPMSTSGGFQTTNPAAGFAAYTSPPASPGRGAPLIGLQPNVKYKLTATSPYTWVSQFGAVPIGTAMLQGLTGAQAAQAGGTIGRTPWGLRDWIFGGHNTGEILRFTTATSVLSRFVQLPGGTGNDDTLVLPIPYVFNKPGSNNGVFGQMLGCAAMSNGVMVLVGMGANVPLLVTLPTLPSAAQATGGCAQMGDWLYVCSGQSVYGIRPLIDTSWITAYTTTDAAVVGVCSMGSAMYVTNNCSAISVLRVRKFILASNSTGAISQVTSGGHDSLEIAQTNAPVSLYGPVAGTGGLYIIYFGTNGATLGGFESGGGTTGQRGILKGTYNVGGGGVTWKSDQDITTACSGSSSITIGPLVIDIQGNVWQTDRYNTTNLLVERSGLINLLAPGSFAWEAIYNANPGAEMIYPLLPVS